MNGKVAKQLRNTARLAGAYYVKMDLLPPEQSEGASMEKLFAVLPKHGYYRDLNTVKLGLGSQRWWYKQLKKNPIATYQEIRDLIKR